MELDPTSFDSLAVIDLFSGVGGLSLGAIKAGFRLLAAVDNDARTAKVFCKNFPECKHIQQDIAQLAGDRLLELAGVGKRTVHGLIGGPPCQGFSRIGHRAIDDARNTLFDHFFRIVAEIRPWFYLAENVLGILDAPFETLRKNALARLEGYRHIEPMILKSSDFGAATSRERVFFIGYIGEHFNEMAVADFRPPDIEPMSVQEALLDLPLKIDPSWQKESEGWRRLNRSRKGKHQNSIFCDFTSGTGDPEALRRLREERQVSGCLGTKHTKAVLKRFAKLKEGSVDSISRAVRLERKGFCPTLRAGTGPDRGSFQALRPIHPTQPRVITPREAARLQGFPDWFQFDATKWHSFRQIGNSVSPVLAESIMRIVAAHVRREGNCNGK